MRGRHIGHDRLVGICLASLLVLLTFAVTACGANAADTGSASKTATSTASGTTASAEDATVSSLRVPVSNGQEGMWDTTTTTGSGPADLYCSVSFAASRPKSAVGVSLFNEAGEQIGARAGVDGTSPGYYTFKGLEPGKYRLGVFGTGTGYVSQWYGGLPMQGHDISESQVLELKPGRNVAEFVLQPGLSIKGEVSWTQGSPTSGYILVYDLQHRDTGGGAAFGTGTMTAGTRYEFLIVGLLPGRYKIGATFDLNDLVPQVWAGGGSFEDAPVIDLTSGDVAGIHVELGALPTTTTTNSR
jgi:hypothetical protein